MNLTTQKDRLRRSYYILSQLTSFLIFAFFAINIFKGEEYFGESFKHASPLMFFVAFIAYFIHNSLTSIKRLHDMGKPGSWYFASFIPIYNLFFALTLLFEKGTVGVNKYGADPCDISSETHRKNLMGWVGIVIGLGLCVYGVGSYL